MTAEEIWQRKNDDEVIAAAHQLEEYTELGRQIILVEMMKRGLSTISADGGSGSTQTSAGNASPHAFIPRASPRTSLARPSQGQPGYHSFEAFPVIPICRKCGTILEWGGNGCIECNVSVVSGFSKIIDVPLGFLIHAAFYVILVGVFSKFTKLSLTISTVIVVGSFKLLVKGSDLACYPKLARLKLKIRNHIPESGSQSLFTLFVTEADWKRRRNLPPDLGFILDRLENADRTKLSKLIDEVRRCEKVVEPAING